MCSESGRSCGPSGPPDGPGVEGADFVLYVSGLTTERCGQENIVAYAAYCQLEAELDRWAEQRPEGGAQLDPQFSLKTV